MSNPFDAAWQQEAWVRLESFSRLAGPLEPPPTDGTYEVRFRDTRKTVGSSHANKAILIAVLNVLFECVFFAYLVQPGHFSQSNPGPLAEAAWIANIYVICSIVAVETLRLINVVSLSLASITARDPIPVEPDPSLRVAFLTTIVPSKEPIAVVRETLIAARRIRHNGPMDVWLLDEGDDPDVKGMCQELGVRHFTRKGVEHYNQPKGAFRARTKHGNYNAWLDSHGDGYDVFLSVDPDHVPLANFAERILGYFRDPDVAYVVGPQCYRNFDTFVTRAAESQQFPFHSVIQRAANRHQAAMLVGTNNAIRVTALRSVGGLSDSITEDMATGLALHASRNPQTRRRWKSVYTPDVLSAGEGPNSWTDYFSQQRRWSRGTFEVLLHNWWRTAWRLSPGRLLHYSLITTFYPSMAIGWILGFMNAILFLGLGVSGITVAPSIWFALYIDATAFSLWLYLSTRRYNVSPFEAEGSRGIKGMMMSVVCAPIYAIMLGSTLARRPARFVVTPKGASSTSDGLRTFRGHVIWAGLLAATLATSFVLGYASVAALLWPAIAFAICLAPLFFWRLDRGAALRRARAATAGPASLPRSAGDITQELPTLQLAQSPPRVLGRASVEAVSTR